MGGGDVDVAQTPRLDRVYALIDGNSFYCSCERAFALALNGKPVIVLSNNDGCAVARTGEAKALGIPMGAPYFKIRARLSAYEMLANAERRSITGR